ncbi:hypothetical protein ACE1SV_35490 [Streptomyces sp. E-15]
MVPSAVVTQLPWSLAAAPVRAGEDMAVGGAAEVLGAEEAPSPPVEPPPPHAVSASAPTTDAASAALRAFAIAQVTGKLLRR